MKEIRHMKKVVRGMNKPFPPNEGGGAGEVSKI